MDAIQSNQDFFLDDLFLIEVDHIKMSLGMGQRLKLTGYSTNEYAKGHPKAIYMPITNIGEDFMCLAYAIILY